MKLPFRTIGLRVTWVVTGIWFSGLVAFLIMLGCGLGSPREGEPGEFAVTHDKERLPWANGEKCRDCHEEEYQSWKQSHHGNANRLVDMTRDGLAFPAEPITKGTETWEFLREEEGIFIEVTQEGESTDRYEVAGMIGHFPLWQYLLKFPGGRYQTAEMSFDPVKKEWFPVFGIEVRFPEEWGHWSSQGMNWNANCAFCHMTSYEKNYNPENDTYQSTWVSQKVTCAQCHGEMRDHVKEAKKAGDDYKVETPQWSTERHMENCATCHSRREQITDDEFEPGDNYDDHFQLVLPNYTDIYHPDGQVNDENYVYAAFQMSRMGHKGVTCMDCHDPHSGATLQPATNNMLCMRCHGNGLNDATIIKPLEHSQHKADNAGNQCVTCHMPKNVFMDRDWRRDHIFSNPDPYLTQELGIPNTCNQCHDDKSVEWAKEYTDKWYGEDMNQADRERAMVVARYRRGEAGVGTELLKLARNEEIDAWRAALVGMLGDFVNRNEVRGFLNKSLSDSSSLVRESAVRGLGNLDNPGQYLDEMMDDPSRMVRTEAGYILAGEASLSETMRSELESYFLAVADTPMGSFKEADYLLRTGEQEKAVSAMKRGLKFERSNPELFYEASILSDRASRSDLGIEWLKKAHELAPGNPRYPYSLGLLYGGQQRFGKAVEAFEDSLHIDPEQPRVLYNLALALTKQGRWEEAHNIIQSALDLQPQNPDFQYVRDIIRRNL